MYDWLSDEALIAKELELRERAHNANGKNYAARARDWENAHNALLLRKLARDMPRTALDDVDALEKKLIGMGVIALPPSSS